MKEKLQEYALLAEIIGAIAIVASLLFVGLQINQSNQLNKINAYQESRKEITAISQSIISNPVLAEGLLKVTNIDELSSMELWVVENWAFAMYNYGDMAYKQFEGGFMSEPDLIEVLDPIRFWTNYIPIKEHWDTTKIEGPFDSRFVEFVDMKLIGH